MQRKVFRAAQKIDIFFGHQGFNFIFGPVEASAEIIGEFFSGTGKANFYQTENIGSFLSVRCVIFWFYPDNGAVYFGFGIEGSAGHDEFQRGICLYLDRKAQNVCIRGLSNNSLPYFFLNH